MPVKIPLTSAAHGGNKACGGDSCSVGKCGVECDCGCPYTGMEEKGRIEEIAVVEQRHPNEWLCFVIPPGEDELYPERGMLVVHSSDDNEVWDAANRITNNQVVHVYFNGALTSEYMAWAQTEPELPGLRVPPFTPPKHFEHKQIIPLM